MSRNSIITACIAASVALLCSVHVGAIRQLKHVTLTVTSDAFQDGSLIPREYTCDVSEMNDSPQLRWRGAPANTQGYAIIMEDRDAPNGVWTHWVMYQIRAAITEIGRGAQIFNAQLGSNSWGNEKYQGPCPPKKDKAHSYHFRVFALDTYLGDLKPSATRQELLAAMEGHVLAEGQLVGKYARTESVFK